MPDSQTVKILLVEDSPSDARLIKHTLGEVEDHGFEVTWVERLEDAIARLREKSYHVGLLDLSLPDSSGVDTIARMQEAAPALPLVVLTGQENEAVGLEAIRRGVQDYLVKGVADAKTVARSIRYAVERKRSEEDLRRLNAELARRLDEIQAGVKALEESRKAAINLMEDAVKAREQAEQASADLRKSQEELIRSRAEWIETFDLIPDLIAILDEDHHIVRVNKSMAQRMGVSQEQAIGMHCYQCVHGAGGPPASCPHTLLLRDGKQHTAEIHEERLGGDFLVSVTPMLDESGKFKGAVHVAHDITQRKKREEELNKLNRALRAHSRSSHAMVRTRDESEYMAKACKIIVEDCGYKMVWIGFAENDEGKSVRPVASAGFEQEYLDTLDVTWADTERGRGPTGTAIRTGAVSQCRNMLSDPAFAPWREEAIRRGYASSIVFPLANEDTVFGAITIYSEAPDSFLDDEINLLKELSDDVAHGITAIRLRDAQARSEQALKARAEELTFVNQELEAFSYTVSHELRTPMHSMLALAELLGIEYRDKLDANGAECLDKIRDGVQRMSKLITNILYLSRVTRKEMQREEVDLSALVKRLAGELRELQPDRKVDMKVQRGVVCSADSRLAELVFQNLLSNAWKYTRKLESATVEFGMEMTDGKPAYFVRDNGAGFDQKYEARLFAPFQRLHRDEEFEGSGIGLAIVERVIRRHGGRVWAKGEEGKGATFYFTLR